MGGVLCHQLFRISIRRVDLSLPLPAILSRFRPKEISFFRENLTPAFNAHGWRLEAALFFLDQNFAFAGVIGLADDAFEFHALHQ